MILSPHVVFSRSLLQEGRDCNDITAEEIYVKRGEGGSMSQGILNPRAAEGNHKILAILGPKYFHWVTFVNWTAGGSVV